MRACELQNVLRRKSTVIRACWLGVLLLVLCPRLAAAAEESQAAAPEHSISGNVLDPSASLVEGAQVELVDSDGKHIALTSTDRMGTFHFDRVPRRKYRVAVRASGFKEARVDVTMGAKPVQPLRISLSIAAISETVDVNAEETGIALNPEATENQNANNIDHNALDRVPVFDQDYVTMLSRFLDDNAIGTNGISLVVNGVEANGPGVSASAVQEVKINQNPYSARFARPGRARLEITSATATSSLQNGPTNCISWWATTRNRYSATLQRPK